ncbi:MAG TPA: hypothetical protein VMS18_07980 [Candidatus Binatia bacterium]|nr:hypothetical protein [Candidatus Binatia bacterium]
MAVAITGIIFAIGNIVFGHFEEQAPKWRRVAKVVLVLGLVAALAARFGPWWGLFPIGLMLVGFVVVHLWWLPHRYGINGLTAEPKERYYELPRLEPAPVAAGRPSVQFGAQGNSRRFDQPWRIGHLLLSPV